MILDSPIRQFLALAEELHFGRAAARLYVSQPALSASIKNLERKLGIQLLKRSSRHVELTEAGMVFVEEARQLSEQADRALAHVRGAADDYTGALRIGYSPAVNLPWIAAMARELNAAPAPMNAQLLSMETMDAVRLLEAGKLDAGVVAGIVCDAELRSEVLFREPLLLAVSADHPLARGSAITVEDLSAHTLLWLRRELNPFLVESFLMSRARLSSRCGARSHDLRRMPRACSRRTRCQFSAAVDVI